MTGVGPWVVCGVMAALEMIICAKWITPHYTDMKYGFWYFQIKMDSKVTKQEIISKWTSKPFILELGLVFVCPSLCPHHRFYKFKYLCDLHWKTDKLEKTLQQLTSTFFEYYICFSTFLLQFFQFTSPYSSTLDILDFIRWGFCTMKNAINILQ